MNFTHIIERIKKIKSLHDDHEVATLLGFSKSAFSERKRRNSIPYTKLELFCERESINMDWLLTGEGPIERGYPSPEEKPLLVAEEDAIYNKVKDDPDLAEIVDILQRDLPEAKKTILGILRARKELKTGFENLLTIPYPEKRREPRVKKEIPLTIVHQEQEYEAKTVDISEKGMKVCTDISLPAMVGDIITMKISNQIMRAQIIWKGEIDEKPVMGLSVK